VRGTELLLLAALVAKMVAQPLLARGGVPSRARYDATLAAVVGVPAAGGLLHLP